MRVFALVPAVTCVILLALIAPLTASLPFERPPGAASEQPLSPLERTLERYWTNEELSTWVLDYTTRCGHISRAFVAGLSARDRAPVWVVEISDAPGEAESEPSFQYTATIHGDEPLGRQLLPSLAELLCAQYNDTGDVADDVRRLVDETHLFLIPNLNPDGYQRQQRGNGYGVDLNREFPDPILNPHSNGSLAATGMEQAETAARMELAREFGFTATAVLHEGALVANYPYDGSVSGQSLYNATADDPTFRFLATSFADLHATMHGSNEFEGGVTNGAEWYPITGGSQDWHYLAAGTFELTIELNVTKAPDPRWLPLIWQYNRDVLLRYPLLATMGGIRGVVQGEDGEPLQAHVYVDASPVPTQSSEDFGSFFRPANPGDHVVHVQADGYVPWVTNVTVPKSGLGVHVEANLTQMPLENMRWVGSVAVTG